MTKSNPRWKVEARHKAPFSQDIQNRFHKAAGVSDLQENIQGNEIQYTWHFHHKITANLAVSELNRLRIEGLNTSIYDIKTPYKAE